MLSRQNHQIKFIVLLILVGGIFELNKRMIDSVLAHSLIDVKKNHENLLETQNRFNGTMRIIQNKKTKVLIIELNKIKVLRF